MSCKCVAEQWQRDRERQRRLAKQSAKLTGKPYVLYKMPDGRYGFAPEGGKIKGEAEEILTQY